MAAAATVENLSFPSPVSELELEIVLDWAVDPVVIETVLAAAMVETWAIGATCGDQPPKCRICRLDGSGVAYKIIYLMDPRRKAKGPARHALLGCVHKHLRHAGLRPVQETPVPGGVPPQQPVDHGLAADRAALLQRLPLLADALSQVVSGYQQRDADRAALHEPDGGAPRRRAGLAERIRAFFGA